MYVLWVALPAAALTSCVAGHIWRYRHDRFLGYLYGPHTDRAQHFGSRAFRIGVPLLFATRITEALASGPHSRPPAPIHLLITTGQLIAIPLAMTGACLILIPPIIAADPRPRITPIDRITLPVLATTLLTAVLITFDPYSTDTRYRTAEHLFTWARSLATLHPTPEVMHHAPTIYQSRALTLMLLIAIWPYTRLAGIFTVPLTRLLRHTATLPWQALLPARQRS
ncbi:respiratory nitrate reductase subunit gamma [Nocardia crassostreae]|uniref:respiratory nitrate reductase subunit gamma n=1 Tax=Nocardia crassostreae TaxID=53428 RepID=UPI001FE21FEC|nr:respiratory nitrate reductase subunit gamma [Nocardia crassostreae]